MRLLFCFVIFLTSQRLEAQKLDFSIKLGQEFSAPRKSSLNDIVGHDGTGIYVVKERFRGVITGGTSYSLEHYNNNFAPTKSYDLEIKEDGRYCQIQHLLHLKNRLYIFYSLTNLKERRNILYVREINKATLAPESEKRKIGEIDFSGESKYNSGSFNFKISRDSSKLAVIYALPFNEDEPEAFGFNVLDDDLNSIWEKQTTLPYRDDLFTTESFKVDNRGNVYLLGLAYKEKRRSKRKGKPNYNYEVFAWSDKGKEMKQYSIALEDRFLTDMQIEVIDNRNLVCAGFYSEKGTFSVRGTYFLTIDLISKEIKAKSFKEFGLDFIVQNMSEREANRTLRREERGDEAELYEYDLDKLLVGKDGSAILIGEQYFMKEVTTTMYINGRPRITTSYHFYYNDIIAVKIDPTGQIEWADKISKTQHTVDDNGFYSSYTLAILKGKICFFFNDHPENLGYKGIGRPQPYYARESLVIMVSLNQKGEQTRQPVFSSRDVEVITRPKVCEQISNYEVILFGQRRKTQQFAKVMVN